MRDAAFERDGVEFGPARRLPAAAGVAAFAMLHHFGGPFESADFADAGDVLGVPLDAEFEILVGIEALCVDRELCHGVLLLIALTLHLDLTRDLLNLDDHELGGLERRKT